MRCLALLVLAGAGCAADDAYVAEIQKWRQENDEFLRSEKSPLRLVGRFQVAEGASTVGSDPSSTIVFTGSSAEANRYAHPARRRIQFRARSGNSGYGEWPTVKWLRHSDGC
jgi:hypothetical protein